MTFSVLKRVKITAALKLACAAGMMMSVSLAVAGQDMRLPQGLIIKGCQVKDKITECQYQMNSLKPLVKLISVQDQAATLQATATLDKDQVGSQAFVYLVNLPDMERKQSTQLQGALRALLLKTNPAWKVGMFTSDADGLNVIGAVGGDRGRMLDILEKWKSPASSPRALDDFKSALRIAGATDTAHKGFQWITTGLSLSAADEQALAALAKSLNVRVGIIHVLETEADINRFAGMKNLATAMGAHYQTIRLDQGDAVFTAKQGYAKNGMTVTVQTAALCGDKTLDITLDHSGTALKISEKISYPACAVKEAPKEKSADKAGDKQTDQKNDQKTGDQKDSGTDQKKPDQQDQQKQDQGQKETQKDTSKDPAKGTAKDGAKDQAGKPESPKQGDQSKDGLKTDTQDKNKDPKSDQKSDTGKETGKDPGKDPGKDKGKDPQQDKKTKADPKQDKAADGKDGMMIAIVVLAGLVLAIVTVMIIRRKKGKQHDPQPGSRSSQGLSAQYNEGNLTGSLTISGDGADREIPLSGQSVRIGRSEENDVVLTDTAVSGFHGLIRIEAGDVVTYTDLNSTNGTYVNNQQIDSIVLHGGEQMRIGASLLVYNR